MSPILINESSKGKEKVNVEKVKVQMNNIWKKEECCTSSSDEVTSSNGSGDHITPN